MSEYKRGELYRITHSQGSYNQSIHLHTGYDIFAGLAIHEASGTLYAIAQRSSDKACVILNVDTREPETASVVATLPKLGNGLAIDQASGMLYATAEGDFIPFEVHTQHVCIRFCVVTRAQLTYSCLIPPKTHAAG